MKAQLTLTKMTLVVLSVAGCAPSQPAVGEQTQALYDEDVPGKKNQGDSLRGTQLAGSGALVSFAYQVPGTPSKVLIINQGKLFLSKIGLPPPPPDPSKVDHLESKKGDPIIGTQLTGYDGLGNATQVTIMHAVVLPHAPGTLGYDVRTADGAQLCSGPDPDDSYAIPLRGTWDAQGYHVESNNRFTFACRRGVLSKCYRWGYRPWDNRNGVSLAPYFQTCSRMARADFCGDGIAHTVDGTWIDGYDRFTVDPAGGLTGAGVLDYADKDSMLIEAAWGPDDAVARTGGALCLSKDRWSTIALDPACRARLPVCGESAVPWLTGPALLFSNSPVTDRPLRSCGNTGDAPATCMAGNNPSVLENLVEGAVYDPDLDENYRVGSKPLYQYTGENGVQVTTTDAVAPTSLGDSTKVLLGYILSAPTTSTAKALHRYRWDGFIAANTKYLTTSDPSRVPVNASEDHFEGYLPR
jgi:hypothetical protein